MLGWVFPKEVSGNPIMRRAWDNEVIFPIKDAASAALMLIKADCLHKAGVISEGEKQWVDSRARTLLDDATPQRRSLIAAEKLRSAAFPPPWSVEDIGRPALSLTKNE
jgi:hypothetical protein